MSDIDEQLTGLIHDWFARLRGQISAGNSEFLGGDALIGYYLLRPLIWRKS